MFKSLPTCQYVCLWCNVSMPTCSWGYPLDSEQTHIVTSQSNSVATLLYTNVPMEHRGYVTTMQAYCHRSIDYTESYPRGLREWSTKPSDDVTSCVGSNPTGSANNKHKWKREFKLRSVLCVIKKKYIIQLHIVKHS